MIIKFDITDLEIDLTDTLKEDRIKEWWFRNAKVSVDKDIEDLTEEDKINMIKLAIYEDHINDENLCNLSSKHFKIK
jgi:hypothetical protein